MSEQLTLVGTCRHGSNSQARCGSMAVNVPLLAGVCQCCGCRVNLRGTGLSYPSCRRCHAGVTV